MSPGSLSNIFRLGLKELKSLWADKTLLVLIFWAFSGAIYTAATGAALELRHAPIAIVDEDHSPLSRRLIDAFYPPYFSAPQVIELNALDAGMDSGRYNFTLVIPSRFQRDVEAGKVPDLQLNIDATIMTQAFIGSTYVKSIVLGEINEYLTGKRDPAATPIKLTIRVRFNPNLIGYWFGGVVEAINNVTMLTIILVGAAFLREREHGTIEHLVVMPLTPVEIMLAKIWANGLAVLIGVSFALIVMVERVLNVPIAGSLSLFLAAAACYLFAAASIGIFLGTLARSMPQFGLLVILCIIPLLLLSGGVSPRESMPPMVQNIMLGAPTTYFVRLAQGILFRGAGIDVVWGDLMLMGGVGAVFFSVALYRFRKAVTQSQA